jgi:hypothetical protein
MPTVVQLGGDRLMVVNEGVEPFTTGGVRANVVNSIQSWDGGRTWDTSLRRTVYRSPIHSGSGRRYNAYAPYAIRVGNGPVGVAFCTDVGYVSTTTSFETWSGASAIWTGSIRNYTPGLFERSLNDVIVTIDAFAGNQRVMRKP